MRTKIVGMALVLLAAGSVAQGSDVSLDKWVYALGAQPQDKVGAFHLGGALVVSVATQDQENSPRALFGFECDYSRGKGATFERRFEQIETRVGPINGAEEIVMTDENAVFSFLSTGFLFGMHFPRPRLTAIFDVGNAFWQTKLKNWATFPTYLGAAVKWHVYKPFVWRVADVRWYFRANAGGGCICVGGPCGCGGGGADSTALGVRYATGLELNW